jgi:hypothetical protein
VTKGRDFSVTHNRYTFAKVREPTNCDRGSYGRFAFVSLSLSIVSLIARFLLSLTLFLISYGRLRLFFLCYLCSFILSGYTMCLISDVGLYALGYEHNMHEYNDSRRTMYVGTDTTSNTCADPYHLCAATFRSSHVSFVRLRSLFPLHFLSIRSVGLAIVIGSSSESKISRYPIIKSSTYFSFKI